MNQIKGTGSFWYGSKHASILLDHLLSHCLLILAFVLVKQFSYGLHIKAGSQPKTNGVSSAVGRTPRMSTQANEDVFCLCQRPEYGNMIKCDDPDCAIEWFHMPCVELQVAPPSGEKWYCKKCKCTRAWKSARARLGVDASRLHVQELALQYVEATSEKKTEVEEGLEVDDSEEKMADAGEMAPGAEKTKEKAVRAQPPNAAFNVSRTAKWPTFDDNYNDNKKTGPSNVKLVFIF